MIPCCNCGIVLNNPKARLNGIKERHNFCDEKCKREFINNRKNKTETKWSCKVK